MCSVYKLWIVSSQNMVQIMITTGYSLSKNNKLMYKPAGQEAYLWKSSSVERLLAESSLQKPFHSLWLCFADFWHFPFFPRLTQSQGVLALVGFLGPTSSSYPGLDQRGKHRLGRGQTWQQSFVRRKRGIREVSRRDLPQKPWFGQGWHWEVSRLPDVLGKHGVDAVCANEGNPVSSALKRFKLLISHMRLAVS